MKRFESLSIALLDQIESNVCEYNDKDVYEDDNEMKKVPGMTGECFWNHFCIFMRLTLYWIALSNSSFS